MNYDDSLVHTNLCLLPWSILYFSQCCGSGMIFSDPIPDPDPTFQRVPDPIPDPDPTPDPDPYEFV